MNGASASGDTASPVWPQYVLADLTIAGTVPYWAVHAVDEDGSTSSWILHACGQDDPLALSIDVWIPAAIQAIVGDTAGRVWAITTDNALVTNAQVDGDANWSPIEKHPSILDGDQWHTCELTFVCAGVPRAELATCMLWAGDTLLIGTFNRCIYRRDGRHAIVEYDPLAAPYSGGINDIIMTARGVHALGFGGTVVRRSGDSTWSALDVPWAKDEAQYVNVVAGVEGPDGELLAVAKGGWVFAADEHGVQVTHQLPAEPLGITTFQGETYASTLDGCYQLMGAGHATLVKSGIFMGKAIDAGTTLIAVDADPQAPGRASAHMWLCTRSADRWSSRTVG